MFALENGKRQYISVGKNMYYDRLKRRMTRDTLPDHGFNVDATTGRRSLTDLLAYHVSLHHFTLFKETSSVPKERSCLFN